jgi:hypothetical protein
LAKDPKRTPAQEAAAKKTIASITKKKEDKVVTKADAHQCGNDQCHLCGNCTVCVRNHAQAHRLL